MISGYTVRLKRVVYQMCDIQVDAYNREDAVERAYDIDRRGYADWLDIDEEIEVDAVFIGPEFGSDGA